MKANVLILIALLSSVLLLSGCTQNGAEGVADVESTQSEPAEQKPELGDMVVIPAGEFTMGSDEKAGNPPMAAPAHPVDLPEYEIDVYEVTNGEFARFQIESDYEAQGDWRSFYTIGKEDFPVANVIQADAKAYCEWAGKRLPTEAEWEKAARGPEGLAYPWGPVFDFNKANTNEHGERNTLEVGSIPTDKSPYGLYDMMGNIQEWTSDVLTPYPGGKKKGVGPVYNGNYVVVRGASYAMKGASMFLWTRSGYFPNVQFGLGFRCARGGETAESN